MHLKQFMKRAVALVLVLTLLMSLTACSEADIYRSMFSLVGLSVDYQPGDRLKNSTWINSDLENSIDETTELNLKDDFHTTVNRDWFLENNAEGDELILSFTEIDEALKENRHRLLTPGTEFDADPAVMNEETLRHLYDLLWDMMDLAGNQEKRNELGVEPLGPYLDAIAQIDSLEEMTEYLKNADGKNFTTEKLFNFGVNIPNDNRSYYTVLITFPAHKLLSDFGAYLHLSAQSYEVIQAKNTAVEHVLKAFDYTPEQIQKILSNCFKFESRICYLAPRDADMQKETYAQRGNKAYTLEDLRKLQGNFPLVELLEDAGVAHSETFRVYEPGLLSFMGSYYKERNLDTLKAYLMVHTILDALPYMDETCETLYQNIQDAESIEEIFVESGKEAEAAAPKNAEEERLEALYNDYIKDLLKVPYELAYIGSYCTSTTKQNLLNLLEDIRTFYIELIANTEWMSPETRALAIDKMQKMKFRVLYPDVMPDYSGLTYHGYDEGGNLLDAIAAIQKMEDTQSVEKINQPVDRGEWDLKKMPTTTINAGNETTLNSILIFSGMLAGGFMYDENAPVEQNYGRLGTILGHEITHAFDTDGYKLDAEGLSYGWWTNEDEVAFRQRSDKLANYYSGLHIYPGMEATYNGSMVQTEAISDMGGMKCMLALAEEIPDFDYDLFFRSYANVWRCQTSLETEMSRAGNDVHPLAFLRTNVTLQQFDKFFETYDIGPGDGMYLAPEDRILVW